MSSGHAKETPTAQRGTGELLNRVTSRIRWDKQPPVPSLPADVVHKTREKYIEAFERLTKTPFVA